MVVSLSGHTAPESGWDCLYVPVLSWGLSA